MDDQVIYDFLFVGVVVLGLRKTNSEMSGRDNTSSTCLSAQRVRVVAASAMKNISSIIDSQLRLCVVSTEFTGQGPANSQVPLDSRFSDAVVISPFRT